MTKKRSRGGYILPVALLVLSCTLLFGSILLLNLSDQYAASNDQIRHEQSRWLARSGWNLAVHQLEESGNLNPLQIEKPFGQIHADIHKQTENQLAIQVSAEAQGYPSTVEGIVRLLEIPWREISDFPVVETMQNLEEAALFCTSAKQILLDGVVEYPLAVSSLDNSILTAEVQSSAVCKELYINGNLQISENASLTAEAVYVSGSISGAERIVSDRIFEQYTTGIDYRVLPVSWTM